MRIKLILENDISIKKRKLWYLVDKDSCRKVADISYLIKKRFFTADGKISLSLDGFLIPPQEDISIIQDNDIITVKSTQHAPASSSSESDTSSSESEKNNQTSKVKIPVKKTIVKRSKSSTKPSDVLKKVASTIPTKSPIKCVNILTNSTSVLTKTNVNKTIVPKTIPLSKLGISNVTEKDSTTDSSDSSSSSSEEETLPVKKKTVPPLVIKQPFSKKTNNAIHSKVKSSSDLINKSNKDAKNVNTINHSVNSKSTKQSSSSSSDSSDSSSDSSDSSHGDKKTDSSHGDKKTDSSHGDKKRKVIVDVHVPKQDKNLSSTTSLTCVDNNIHNNNNNKPGYLGKSKAKKMVSKDVYKNQSQFIISKPFSMDDTEKNMIGGSLNTKEENDGNSNSKVSRKTLRNRRRKRARKENQLHPPATNKEQDDLNISTIYAATNGDSVEAITTNNEKNESIIIEDNEKNESIIIEDNTMTVLESKPPSKNYDSFVKLTEPPDVGSMIAYKVLEMSPIHYTPEVSDYKEACMKSYDKENNLLELELSEVSQSITNEGDSQVKGRFEMPDTNEDDLAAETQNTVLVKWTELIEPCLII